MKILGIIPARMGSSRFPGKPLKKINGIPMVEYVYNNIKKNKLITELYIATCDKEIMLHCKNINAKSVMTSKKHQRASERCAEALLKIEKKNKISYDIVVMIQGDEPMINSHMVNEALNPMIKNRRINVTNLLGKITNKNEFNDKNCIKVVTNKNLNAIYFSRYAIPTYANFNNSCVGKQICVIPFRRNFLLSYNSWKISPLEKLESIDMLRVIENGYDVKMVKTKYKSFSVDTIQDLKKVSKILSGNRKN